VKTRCAGGEAEFAAWWADGAICGYDLPTSDGRTARVLFQGRAGGPVGPDFRDAVILLDGARRVGDIELHLRAANWYNHRHQTDPRYDNVILHAVACGPLPPEAVTRLASGAVAPLVVLDDRAGFADPSSQRPVWPCQAQPLPAPERAAVLAAWGRARFAERVARFRADLARQSDPAAALDAMLLAAIAESLGYGRREYHRGKNRTRHEGREGDEGPEENLSSSDLRVLPYLCGLHVSSLDLLSARRLQGLVQLAEEWARVSPGAVWCGAVLAGGERAGWERLLRVLAPAGTAIGRQRGAIVLWNAVLPVLAAYGDACGNLALAQIARAIAWHAPGLPGNTITRSMTRWLGLPRPPTGALTQQGLHHLHAHWCRAKDCAACPAHAAPATGNSMASASSDVSSVQTT
jgi:hypothetical protein